MASPYLCLRRRRRRSYDAYQVLEQQEDSYEWGTLSAEPSVGGREGSYWYRRDQARRRRIFLRSYNLSFEDRRPGVVGRLKKAMGKVKAKARVVSVAALARWSFFASCRLAPRPLCASSARPGSK